MSNKSFEIVAEIRWLREITVIMIKMTADLTKQMPAVTRSRIFCLPVLYAKM
jgi:hypothetical protein